MLQEMNDAPTKHQPANQEAFVCQNYEIIRMALKSKYEVISWKKTAVYNISIAGLPRLLKW